MACDCPVRSDHGLKGKKQAKDTPGNFRCKDCGAVSKKKAKLCNPKKIK
jgi:rubredoxin